MDLRKLGILVAVAGCVLAIIFFAGRGSSHSSEGNKKVKKFEETKSFKAQSLSDYCLECLVRHYTKALGLLKEAERFSLTYGKITPTARERIKEALEEIVTAEADLGMEVEDKELRKKLDEISILQRKIRKWMWANKLLTTEESIDKLREAINKVKELVDLTYKVAEEFHKKGFECTECEAIIQEYKDELVSKLVKKYGLDIYQAKQIVTDLTSGKEERVREAVKKLKEIGAFEEIAKTYKEVTGEELLGG